MKEFFSTKTNRTCIAGLVAALVVHFTGYEITPEMQVAFLSVVGMFLRQAVKKAEK